MARFWMHGAHLFVNGQKMSKSKGNIYYTDTVMKRGYSAKELRFFLMYGHYRQRLNYSDRAMKTTALKLRGFRDRVLALRKTAGNARPAASRLAEDLRQSFVSAMDNDLLVKDAFDAMLGIVRMIDIHALTPSQASGIVRTLREIDEVLQVIF
jgi:cysteinyl-tRNA synthetase